MQSIVIEIAGYGDVQVGLDGPQNSGSEYISIDGAEVYAESLSEGHLLLTIGESRAIRKALKKAEQKLAVALSKAV